MYACQVENQKCDFTHEYMKYYTFELRRKI